MKIAQETYTPPQAREFVMHTRSVLCQSVFDGGPEIPGEDGNI